MEGKATGAIKFIAGFLDGFIGGNHLSGIEACEVDAEKEEKSIQKALSDLKAGHKVRAIMEFKNIVSNYKTDLGDCAPADMTDDLNALESWA